MNKPEKILSLKDISIWPVLVVPLVNKIDEKNPEFIDSMFANDPDFKDYCEDFSIDAEEVLLEELLQTGLFKITTSDNVISMISINNHNFSIFDRPDWKLYQNSIQSSSVLVAKFSFGRESNGINTYVALTLYDKNSTQEIIEVKFNTKWGKSYMLAQPMEVTLPHAVHGAVNGLVNELQKYPSFKSTE